MLPEDGIEPGFVERLLNLSARDRQTDLLHAGGLLNAAGIERLLDAADRLLGEDPGKAQRLAELCGGLAGQAGSPATVPRADYILVRTHFINGDFDAALRSAEAARRGYMAIGHEPEAMRTDAGKMAVLLELGRYQEALDLGQGVLNALADAEQESPEVLATVATVRQNQGVCYDHMGRYDRALDAYAAAEERFRALGAAERVGEITDNRGIILRYLGRSSEALAAHEAAASIFEKADLTLPYALSLGNIGETHAQLGNFTRSLDAFERARRLLNPLDAPVDEHDVLIDTANTYLALNLFPEALASYREADGLLERSGTRFERAKGLWAMGSALTNRSRFEEAERVLDEAAALLAAVENAPLLSGVMLEQASLLAARENRAAALRTARDALELVSGEDWPVQQVYARLRLADLLLPDAQEAETQLLAARRLAEHLPLPQLRYRLNERLGYLRRLQGRDEEARALLEWAVDEIERLRDAVPQDAMRASFLRDKTAAYEELLLLHLAGDGEEDVRSAYAIAERAKSRALVDLLAGVAEKEPVRSPDPGLGRRIRALQADLNAVYGGLLGGRGDEHPAALPKLHERAVELEQEISRLRLQSVAVGYDPDPFAPSRPPEGIQDRLSPGTISLAYHTVGAEILAFVSARGRIRVARHVGTVDEVGRLLHKLENQWERFRAGREFAGRHAVMLERSARQVLSALYEELVAPLESLLEEAAAPGEVGAIPKLAIVPHGPLHRVPFHALFDGERYLIERFETSYAPSATVYALCQDREPPGRNRAAVFGVEDPLIPAAVTEAHAVAECLPGAGVRVGEDATVEALRGAQGSGVLHLACHGLFRSDNPMFSSLRLHDGWLTAADAMSLDLPGALVTLSACESGRGEVIGGDEVLGLTRVFLGAGAATLVVSLWLVQDETTADLMGDWYGRLRNCEGRAAALRAAQLGIKERHPHPYYWAPFVLIGRR